VTRAPGIGGRGRAEGARLAVSREPSAAPSDPEPAILVPSPAQRAFDYAEWRRRHFADIDIDPAEFNRKAIERDKANPLGAALP